MKTLQSQLITFQTINLHLIDEIKDKIVDIILHEINKKEININDLARQLNQFGFNYPILKVLHKTINTYTVSFDYYVYMCILCGVDLALIMTDTHHTKRNIKNRKNLANKRIHKVTYNVQNLFI